MTFDELTNKSAHAEEIKRTRVGMVGGSDAAFVLRFLGQTALPRIPKTTVERIEVLLGLREPACFSTPATDAGHMFEDYMDAHRDLFGAPPCTVFEREAVIGKKRGWKHFKVIAHADFMTTTGTVYECKYVCGKDAGHVLQTYYAQLQWYYWMGAKKVYLVHGRGSVEPFFPIKTEVIYVPRDRTYTRLFRNGCNALDATCGEILNNNIK